MYTSGRKTLCNRCLQEFTSVRQYDRHLPCDGFPSTRATLPQVSTSGLLAPTIPSTGHTATATYTFPASLKPDPRCTPLTRGHRSTKCLMDSTTVTVIVGQSDLMQRFHIPQEYLISVSHYFEKLFKGGFREATAKEVSLSDVTPTTFRIFNEWLNGRKLLNSNGEPYAYRDEDKLNSRFNHVYSEMLWVYIFADKYDVPQFRQDAMDAWIRYHEDGRDLCDWELVKVAYERLPTGCPLQRFLADSIAYMGLRTLDNKINQIELDMQLKAIPVQFRDDLITAMFCRKGELRSLYANPCRYHEHNMEGREC